MHAKNKKVLHGCVWAKVDVYVQEMLLHFFLVLHSFKWPPNECKEIISSSILDKDD